MSTIYKSKLPQTKSAAELLDMYYLDIRSALVESAAFFDRLDRAGGDVSDDSRVAALREMCGVVAGPEGNRSQRMLEMLSEGAS